VKVGVWGQQKQLNTYNHRIQAINENGQTYNTDYQYYIKIREFSCHSLPGRYTMCETSVMNRKTYGKDQWNTGKCN
jgi:hypothetical protein